MPLHIKQYCKIFNVKNQKYNLAYYWFPPQKPTPELQSLLVFNLAGLKGKKLQFLLFFVSQGNETRSYSACLSVILLITFESIGWSRPPLTQGSHLSDITFPHIWCKSRPVSRRKILLEIYPSHWSAATQPVSKLVWA